MTSLKLQQWPSTSHRFHLTAIGQVCRLVQLPVRSKYIIKGYCTFLAKLHGEEDPECNIWRTYAFYDTLNALNQSCSGNTYERKNRAQPGQLGCGLDEVPNMMSSFGDVSKFPPNHLLVSLLEKLKALHLHLLAAEYWSASHLKLCGRDNLFSATNLTHYLALKGLDLQLLKADLSSIGLLDLESINSHVLASIDIIIQLLHKLLSNTLDNNDSAIYLDKGYSTALLSGNVESFNMETIKKRISHHATGLFGEHRGKKSCHLMVTVGREGASTEMLIPNLLKAGADVIRINCAHDNLTIWSEIIRIVKYNCQMLEKPCRILMDLAGTKLRTQLLRTYLNIVKISPKKDSEGNVIFSAQVWLCCDGCDPPAHLYPNAIICIKKSFFNKLKTGETLDFVDARGRKRFLRVLKKSPSLANYGCMAECLQTTYIKVGTELLVKKKRRKISGQVLKIPAVKLFIRLKVGDLLTIFKSSFMSTNEFGSTALASKVITCSDHLHDLVEVGEPIAFDDGKIQGKIKEKCLSSISVLITHASPKGSKLRAGKSINVPKSKIQFKGLSQKDLIDLDFVGANADMVGISFIRDVAELVFLQHELEKRNLQNLGIILKIETKDGLQRLPSLLFQAMQSSNPVGVMIARGDLMVECGWDKLGDIQEEILSICSAAHIPVIWATQVLESLIKFGFPTRAEITDVAAAMRASCILLNKGENLTQAVEALNAILSNGSKRKVRMTLNPNFHLCRFNQ